MCMHQTPRQPFYATLSDIEINHHGPILLGGDFNCTQHSLYERSYVATDGKHLSDGLATLLDRWNLVNAFTPWMEEDPDEIECTEFHVTQHTYHYTFGRPVDLTVGTSVPHHSIEYAK